MHPASHQAHPRSRSGSPRDDGGHLDLARASQHGILQRWMSPRLSDVNFSHGRVAVVRRTSGSPDVVRRSANAEPTSFRCRGVRRQVHRAAEIECLTQRLLTRRLTEVAPKRRCADDRRARRIDSSSLRRHHQRRRRSTYRCGWSSILETNLSGPLRALQFSAGVLRCGTAASSPSLARVIVGSTRWRLPAGKREWPLTRALAVEWGRRGSPSTRRARRFSHTAQRRTARRH